MKKLTLSALVTILCYSSVNAQSQKAEKLPVQQQQASNTDDPYAAYLAPTETITASPNEKYKAQVEGLTPNPYEKYKAQVESLTYLKPGESPLITNPVKGDNKINGNK